MLMICWFLVSATYPEQVARKSEKVINLNNKLMEMKLELNILKTQIRNVTKYKNSCMYKPDDIFFQGKLILANLQHYAHHRAHLGDRNQITDPWFLENGMLQLQDAALRAIVPL